MKLHIEIWLEDKQFSSEVNLLFEESVKCYKASAYRASLLFSFLAFETIIKERVLKATKPEHINEHSWNTIHKNLRNDDNWDTEVIECIKKSDPNKKIFDISEDLRHQAIYWKNRRNDCAHSKNNIITDSHVESFWYFIKANLYHFVLPGSLSSILNKINIHFDTNYTPEDKPYDFLISESTQIVTQTNVSIFITDLLNIFQRNNPFWPYSLNERELAFIETLILTNEIIASELLEKIKSNEKFYHAFIEKRPSRLQYFLKYPETIHKTWKVNLFKWNTKISLELLAALLRYQVIPSEQISTIFKKVISQGFDLKITEADIEVLVSNGFIIYLKELIFIEHDQKGKLINDFDWANKFANIAAFYLSRFEIDPIIVNNISRTFMSYPYPFKALAFLKEFFSENPNIKEAVIKIAAANNIILPESLGFEDNNNFTL